MADMRHYVNLRGLSDSEIIERTAEFIDAEQSQSLTDFELAMTEAGTNRATVEKALTQYRAQLATWRAETLENVRLMLERQHETIH